MISCCMITRGEPTLARAIASIRPYVAEVCVVFTGDNLGSSFLGIDRAAHFAWSDDFSAARNASFALATQPWVMWLDSDDTLEGGEHLRGLCEHSQGPTLWALPYDYEHDALGNVTCTLMRARLVTRGDFEWRGAVHEDLVSIGNSMAHESAAPRIIHHRTPAQARESAHRNIRILCREVEKDPNDARSLFYLGMAWFDAREFHNAAATLRNYMRLPGNDEERALACMRLATIEELRGDLSKSSMHAYAALSAAQWAECYFAIARVHAAAAEQTGSKREWSKAAHFSRVGLSLPVTRTGTWVNPLDRAFHARVTLAEALAGLGNYGGAVQEAHVALAAKDDEDLRERVGEWERKSK